jgi:hypothetical protein
MELVPVVFRKRFTNEISMMPTEMVKAYVYDFGYLQNLEAAAQIADFRDADNANTILLSINGNDAPLIPFPIIPEGQFESDEFTIQPPTLR